MLRSAIKRRSRSPGVAIAQPVHSTIGAVVSDDTRQAVVPVLAAPVATDANIAQAMIQSMLGAKGPATSSAKVATTKAVDPKAAKAAKAVDKTLAAFSLTPVATPVTIPFVAGTCGATTLR